MLNKIEDRSWVGVDFDGVLCDTTNHPYPLVGPPIWSMVRRVQSWLDQGLKVKIFTARADADSIEEEREQVKLISEFLDLVELRQLTITNRKDRWCVSYWDDLAVSVQANTGAYLDANRRSEDYLVENFKYASVAKALEASAPRMLSVKAASLTEPRTR